MGDYRGYGKAATPLLPMIGVPTTAGTGSEAQSYAVIADAATHMKMACGDPSAAVRIALLDPELTLTAPHHVTAMAGFDAIAHAVETAVDAAPDAAVGHVLSPGLDAPRQRVRARPAPARRRRGARGHAARRALRRHGDRAIDARRRARVRQSRSPPASTCRTASRSRCSSPTSSAGTAPRRAITMRRCSIRRAAARATTMPPRRSRAGSKIWRRPAGWRMKLSDSGRGRERAARTRGRGRAAVDRHLQSAALRCRGGDGDLSGGAVASRFQS